MQSAILISRQIKVHSYFFFVFKIKSKTYIRIPALQKVNIYNLCQSFALLLLATLYDTQPVAYGCPLATF